MRDAAVEVSALTVTLSGEKESFCQAREHEGKRGKKQKPCRLFLLVARKPLSFKWSLPGDGGAVGAHRPDHDVEGRRWLGTALSPMHIGAARASVYTDAIGAICCGENECVYGKGGPG